ncbi:protein kinase-like domain, concanavalin A-like lectin/glucanase domain protein [Tanacetum coccineum]
MEEKLGEELSWSETVIGECESRDIKWDNLDYKICEDTKEVEEAEEESEESEEEVEEKLKEEEKEEEDDLEYFDTFPTTKELGYHEWILKNPRPPRVNAKVKMGNLNNIKISCMIGQFLKEHAYIDLESPINVMSKLNYYWIISDGLKLRRKLSNPEKISNFVGRVRGLKIFVGYFTYECDFIVLEDTTSFIDHYLGGMVLGKPLVKKFELVYDRDEGMVTFKKDKENITFKMPHKMERFKHINIENLKTDNIPPCIITGDDGDQEKTHYSDSLNLGPEYRRDERLTKSI